MKKLLLTFVALNILLRGVGQVLFSEDFDGVPGPTAGGAGTYSFAPGWLLRNVDNGVPPANVAYINEAWERREDFKFNVTDSAAFSTSWYDPIVPADDWMWTPAIALPNSANVELSWNAVAYDEDYPDGYEVRIMTTTPTGGTGVLGNQVSASTVLFSTAAESINWTNHTVSLAAYANQTVYIGFRNNTNNQFVLLIDDVEVTQLNQYDIAIGSFNPFADQYTLTPQPQAHAFSDLGATITNMGSDAVTNVYLQTDILLNGSPVYTGVSSVIPTLAAAATTPLLLPTTTFVPSAPGSYTVKYTAKMTEADANGSNDTANASATFVSDSTYARDNGTVIASLGIGAGTHDGVIANRYEIYADTILSSVTYYLAATGQEPDMRTRVKVYANAAGIPSTLLATSADHFMIDSLNGELVTLPLNPPVPVHAGDTIWVGVEEIGGATMSLGQTTDIFIPGTVRVNWSTAPFTWASVEQYGPGFARVSVIRPNFGGTPPCPTIATSSTPKTCTASGTAQVTVTGGSGNQTYLWSNGNTTGSITANPGAYTVTVTDGTCTATDNVTITDNSYNLTVTATPTPVVCSTPGSVTTTVSGGATPYTYIWSNSATTADITVTTAGLYGVSVTDDNGCTGIAGTSVTNGGLVLNTTTTTTDATCTSNTGSATATTTNGSGTITYLWSNGATTATTSNQIPGTYTVVATDANGCSAEVTATIGSNNTALLITTASTQALCTSNSGGITTTLGNGTGPYTYNWSTGGTSAGLSNFPAGTYMVTVTDANGCTGEATDSITSNNVAITLTSSTTDATCTAANGTATVTPGNGTSPYNYAWSSGDNINTASSLVPATYTVTVTDDNGCSGTASITVSSANTPVTVTASNTSTACTSSTGSATANPASGTSPYTYLWSNTGTTATINNVGAGSYTVTVTDANGCSGTASTLVTTTNGPTATAAATTINCFGDSTGNVNITTTGGTNPLSYTWSNAATTEDLSNVAAGAYTLTVTDANNCSFSVSATVTQPASAVSFTATVTDASTSTSADGAITVSATGGTGPYTTTPATLTGLTAGNYVVTVTDANGCTAVDSFTVDFTNGITGNAIQQGLKVYPNPTTGNLFVSIQLPVAANLSITMQSVTGAVVYSTRLNQVTNSLFNISMHDFAAGVYTLQITGAGETQTRKVILQY